MCNDRLRSLLRWILLAVLAALCWAALRYVLPWVLPFLLALGLAAWVHPLLERIRRGTGLTRSFLAVLFTLPVLGTGTVPLPWAGLLPLIGNAQQAVALAAVYAVVTLVRSLVEPRIMAAQAGLPPLASLAAVYVGFRTLGVAGMLALPILLLLVKQFHDAVYINLWK